MATGFGAGAARFIWQFGRLSAVGVTQAPLLIGLAVAGVAPRPAFWALCAVGLLFHVGVYVLNDVADVEIDRTDPRRAARPLATGLISTRLATAVAAVSLAAGLALLWCATGRIGPLSCYVLAAAGLVMYDLRGKQSRIPPVMDLIQGAGWGFLVPAGAAAFGRIGAPAVWLACSFCCYIAIVNGMQGSLRDLHNDLAHGARTTAGVFLGDRAEGTVGVPWQYTAYGLSLQLVQAVTCIAGIVLLAMRVRPADPVAVVLCAAAEVACTVMLWRGLSGYAQTRRIWLVGLGHAMLMLWAMFVAVLVTFGPWAFVAVNALFAVPLLASGFVRSLLGGGNDWAPAEGRP